MTAAGPDQPELQVRGPMSIFGRAVAGLIVGVTVGSAVHSDPDTPYLEGTALGGLAGLMLGGAAGVFVWVAFPYRRPPASTSGPPAPSPAPPAG